MLDYSLKRADMEELWLLDQGKMLVLDHHKSAQAECEGLSFCQFDMNRSGAGMTWDYFYPGKPRPKLVSYVEDQDLWRWNLVNSHEINTWISSYPRDFATWNILDDTLSTAGGYAKAVDAGEAIGRYTSQKVEEVCKEARMIDVGGYQVPVVNVPYTMGSETAHRLLELYPDAPFAGYFLFRCDGQQQWGLRGRNTDDFDVSVIAKQYGGGGHKKAAGFERRLV